MQKLKIIRILSNGLVLSIPFWAFRPEVQYKILNAMVALSPYLKHSALVRLWG